MKIVRYLFVGGVAAAIDIGIFSVAVKGFGFDWFFVALVSFLLATAVNYLLSIISLIRISDSSLPKIMSSMQVGAKSY